MKKYRCPHCGEESITKLDKTLTWRMKSRSLGRPERVYNGICPKCDKAYRPIPRYFDKFYRIHIAIEFSLIILIFLYGFIVQNFWFYIFWAFWFLYYGYLYAFFTDDSLYGIVKCLDDNRYYKKHAHCKPNVQISIESSLVNIQNMDIYGMILNKKTRNVRFYETFKNGIIPVKFLKNTRKPQTVFDVEIMKIEFIPNELLSDETSFELIDNGKKIATGKIIKTYD